MSMHTTEPTHVDHVALRRDLRTIFILSTLLFGAIVALWLVDARVGILAKLLG